MVKQSEQYIIELKRYGNSTKVTAVNPTTLKEVCIVVPSGTNPEQAKRIALRKLQYIECTKK